MQGGGRRPGWKVSVLEGGQASDDGRDKVTQEERAAAEVGGEGGRRGGRWGPGPVCAQEERRTFTLTGRDEGEKSPDELGCGQRGWANQGAPLGEEQAWSVAGPGVPLGVRAGPPAGGDQQSSLGLSPGT